MKIDEAVRIALETGRGMATPDFEYLGDVKIKPEDSMLPMNLMDADGRWLTKYGWQPSPEDLMRDDWIIVD